MNHPERFMCIIQRRSLWRTVQRRSVIIAACCVVLFPALLPAYDFAWAVNGYAGSPTGADNDDMKCAIKIRNDSSENINVWLEDFVTGTRLTGTGTSITHSFTGAPSGYTLTSPNSSVWHGQPGSTAITPGNSGWVYIEIQPTCTSGAATADGTLTLTLPCYIKRASQSTYDRFNLSYSKLVHMVNAYSNTSAPPSSFVAPNDGIYMDYGIFPYNGVGPSSGDITATPSNDGHVVVKVGGVTKYDGIALHGQNIAWHTDDPASFLGQHLQIYQDGVLYYDKVLVNEWTGTNPETGLPDGRVVFNDSVNWTADGQKDRTDGNSDAPQPGAGNGKSNAPDNTAPGQYSGRSPGSQGADAKSDNTANTTVAQEYRAIRQGVEDALNGNGDIGETQIPGADVSNAAGTSIGTTMAAGVNSLSTVATLTGMPGSGSLTGSTAGLILPFVGGTTVTVAVPDWAPLCYWLASALITWDMLLLSVKLVRRAFAN